MEDSLEKIKEAENQATKIVEEANIEKEKILAGARKKALTMLEKTEEGAEIERNKSLEKMRKYLEEEKGRRVKSTENQIKKLKEDVEDKIDKESAFLYRKLLEMIE